MPRDSEPSPGAGSALPSRGSAELLFGMGKLENALDRLAALEEKQARSQQRPQGSADPHFSRQPGIQQQWEDMRAFHGRQGITPPFGTGPGVQQQISDARDQITRADRLANAKRQMDYNRQQAGMGAQQGVTPADPFPKMEPVSNYDPGARSRAVRERNNAQAPQRATQASAAEQSRRDAAAALRERNRDAGTSPQEWTPPTFPRMGVPPRPANVGAGSTAPPPWAATPPAPAGAYSNYGAPGGMALPWSPGAGGGGVGNSGAPNGGAQGQIPRPPRMTGIGGGPLPPGAGGGGGAAPGGAAAQKGVFGASGKAIGIGAAGAVVNAGVNVLNNYSQRMLDTNYDQFGNMVVLRSGGYISGSYGQASSRGIDMMRPATNVATTPADLIAGSAQILTNSTKAAFSSNYINAAQAALLSPGMGMGAAAQNQQQEGSAQAQVMAQMMFGSGTRVAGGGQKSESQIADMLVNATRGGQGMAGMTPEKMAAMLSQTGTIRTNLNTYAGSAGLGSEAVDSIANILTAKAAFQNKYGEVSDFDQVTQAAAQGDKSALSKLKGTGIGESVTQSILTRGGAKMQRDMNSQASYIDTLKKTNDVMTSLSNTLTAFMKKFGLSDLEGILGGANSGSGGMLGRVGKAGGYALMGAAVGGPMGAAVGGLYGFISGGADKNATGGKSQNAKAASTGTSSAANAAVKFAQAQLGKPYVMGAAGPNAYDCSGLTMAAYKSAGVSIPRVSSSQSQFGAAVPLDQIGPGDLIFPKGEDGMWGAPPGLPGHVMMALSGGPNVSVVQAGSPSSGIFDSTINVSDIESVRRVTDGVGTLAQAQNKSDTGASNTNVTTTAGKSQAAGRAVTGMNEVDVLGASLGRAAFQGPGTLPASAQVATSGGINGTANRIAGFANGTLRVNGDQTANLHDGEMVIDRQRSASLRAALMADLPTSTPAGGSRGTTIQFASGSIQVSVAGAMTGSAATNAARQIVDAMAADDRLQRIGAGL